MKILSIGDIHGRDQWKFLTHGSPYEYNTWRTACDHGAEPVSDFWSEMPYTAFDKIIFVGDYVDSFTVSNVEIKSNLLDIIDFKRKLGDRVVLLLGNHDVQYIVPNHICSGYRPEAQHDLYQIFTENLSLFTMAYEVNAKDGSNYLWTHAGVTSGWIETFNRALDNPSRKALIPIIEDHEPKSRKISENLNFAWELRLEILFDVDMYSGGCQEWAGPLWVRPHKLNEHRINGINQIVGHTPQATVWTNPVNDTTTHYFIDCIEHGETQALELDLG